MTGDSLPSSPSLTSLDKISTTSVFYRQHFQDQQSIPEKVKVFRSVFFPVMMNMYFRILMQIIPDHHLLPVF
jgi:hypothetical protein